jgi:hypothetical protein
MVPRRWRSNRRRSSGRRIWRGTGVTVNALLPGGATLYRHGAAHPVREGEISGARSFGHRSTVALARIARIRWDDGSSFGGDQWQTGRDCKSAAGARPNKRARRGTAALGKISPALLGIISPDPLQDSAHDLEAVSMDRRIDWGVAGGKDYGAMPSK